MRYGFSWNEWNVDHIAKHNVTTADAEYIVNHSRPPFPQRHGQGKFIAMGQLEDGAYLQVIFARDKYDPELIYVIHARELTHSERQKYRRRMR